MLALADAAGVTAVLSAAVRHAEPGQVRTVDVLDAARRLVVLDSRHLDRVTDAGHLASTADMHARALTVTGGDTARAQRLLAMTARVAAECVQHARDDLGIGAVHLPEPEILNIEPGTDPMDVLAQRCRAAVGRRYPDATDTERQVVLDRLDAELTVVRSLGYPTYFLTVAEVTDLIRARGVRVAARGSGAGSLVNHLLGISGSTRSATGCSWSGSAPRCAPSCRTSTSTSSPPAAPRSTRPSSSASAASASRASR